MSPEERTAAFALADDRSPAGKKLPDKTDELVEAILRKSDTAADIAMFGRMLADNPEFNREAAVQVAHAITTHRVEVEDDFYTAVDDLKKPSEDAGAGFIGELGFGSGVFYLYACIDRAAADEKPRRQYGARRTRRSPASSKDLPRHRRPASRRASPARSRASYLRIEKGSQQPRSLAAAFFKPVRGDDLLDGLDQPNSTELAEQMDDAYGACFDGSRTSWMSRAAMGSLADAIDSLRESAE